MSHAADLAGDSPGTAPSEPQVRVGKLDNARAVRKELARLYRATRLKIGNDLTAGSGAKLAYMLSLVGRSIETEELAERIAELERRIGSRGS